MRKIEWFSQRTQFSMTMSYTCLTMGGVVVDLVYLVFSVRELRA